MQRVNSAILFLLFTAMIGCSAHLSEPRQEQEASRVKQEKDRNPSPMPAFTYRPGAGLFIEGH